MPQAKGIPMTAQTQKYAVELFKTANREISFIAEAWLDHVLPDGTIISKVALILVKRDGQNKAVQTVKYWLDLPTAKVIFNDLWNNALTDTWNEYKQRAGSQKAIDIEPQDEGYQLRVMNKDNGEMQRLFFNLTTFQARALAITVIDHLRAWELAKAIRSIAVEKREQAQVQ